MAQAKLQLHQGLLVARRAALAVLVAVTLVVVEVVVAVALLFSIEDTNEKSTYFP